MKLRFIFIAAALAGAFAADAAEDPELGRLRQEMQDLRRSYEERMQALEKRLIDAESRGVRADRRAQDARSRARKAEQTAKTAGTRAGEAQQAAQDASLRAVEATQSATQAAGRAGEAQEAATRATRTAGMAQELAKDAGTRAETATQAATQASQVATATATRDNAFNPAISLILQGTWARTRQDPDNFAITGFVPSGGEVGPPRRSFGIGESELILTASIDPYFRGALVAALTPENEVEVEEAYFSTLSLPRGFTVKGGRFLSGIGYQNEIHQHAWDFQDAPLPYKAFLGGRLQQDGVQLKWVAPTSLFLEVGGEIARGQAFPGSERNANSVGSSALFTRLGGDLGESYAWRAGLSYLRTSPRNRTYDDVDSLGAAVTNSFTGRARVWIADGVLKWAPGGNATRTNFKLQGEYFRVRQSGALTYDDTAGSAIFGPVTDAFRTAQSGWYAQGVYQFMPRWRVGYRYDQVRSGRIENALATSGIGLTPGDFPILTAHKPTRSTAMLEFNPSDFSRFRLQYAVDKSRLNASDQILLLQYVHSLGPHGAHKF